MYHYRVSLTGSERAQAAVALELAGNGASEVGSGDPRCLILTSEEGISMLEDLSGRHPEAVLGIEWFEAFEDELVRVVIESGRATVIARGGVLPDDWGSFHDEDGRPLDRDLLRRAAETVAAERPRFDAGTLSNGLDTALTMGKALGHLCAHAGPVAWGDPSRDALNAVTELAVLALWVGASNTNGTPNELGYDHALRLTQSVVHSQRSEYTDQPGDADWSEWLQVLLASASHVIDAASDYRFEPVSEAASLGAEHCSTPGEAIETAGRFLLTTCLEVLALFDGCERPWASV